MRMFRLSLLVAMASILGCNAGDDASKGAESAVPEPAPKADSWFAPTLHGPILFGAPEQTAFTDDALFHAWDFTLSGPADVTLATARMDDKVDTVMYLYRREPGTTSFGSYIHRNDDADPFPFSTIAASLDAGEYRVMIKAYKEAERGAFFFQGSCDGGGCPVVPTQNDLTTTEADNAVAALNEICPDTFCGGDWNYWARDAFCDFEAERCTVTFDVNSYYEDHMFTMTSLDGVDPTALRTSGDFGDGTDHSWAAAFDEMVDLGEDGMWLRGTCTLVGGLTSYADLVDGVAIGDPLYDKFIECVWAAETILNAL